MQVDALVDTGSTHTIINSCIYNRFPRLTPLFPAPKLQSITQHTLPLLGSCIVRLAGRPAEVLVCDKLGVDLLIGADLCRHAVVDFCKGLFTLGDQKFPMKLTKECLCPLMATSCIPVASQDVINNVLKAYQDVFSSKETPVNVAGSLSPAEIHTTGGPLKLPPYRMPFSKRQKVEECVDEMLRDGIIRPSHSSWSFPIVLTEKRNGTVRFCVDYRKLNAITHKDAHPLPLIQDVFDSMAGAKIFSTLDLRSGYWQIPMAEDSIPKTAFTCHLGLFEFVRMPFGLTNAPAIFQRAMNKVLTGLIGKCCMVYIDDIVIWSNSEEEHAKHLQLVLERLRTAGLQLKSSKCSFGLSRVELLGHSVSADGIYPLPSRVEAIKNLGPPSNVTGVRSFLGMAGYYRNFIKDFAKLAFPLTNLTKAREPFVWGPEQQEAFDVLKDALTQAPILAHPDVTRPFILYCDASDKAIGSILVQKDDEGVERVISYLSHKLSGTQLKWATIEREAYAIIYSLKKFHAYLWGSKFEIHTDHKPLRSLFQSEIKSSKISRWSIQIQEYQAPIKYHPGKLNIRADMLSRIGAIEPQPEIALEMSPRDVPDVWVTDRIDPQNLVQFQREEFPNAFIEASQAVDDCPYVIEGGILYTMREPSKNAGQYLRLMLPRQYRQQVIDRCHAEVGHAAFMKTLARIQETYIWPSMRTHIKSYISHCVLCNTLTPSHPVHPRGIVPVPPAPFHTWGIDLVGPFPRDRRGRQYLLCCIDHLSGWAEAIPIASKKAETVQEAFLNNIVARYGIPRILISDNGGEFTGAAFEKWLREFGVSHRLTSPYNPQCNGMTERFNATIQKLLLKLTGGNPRKWSEYLSSALYAYRITQGPAGLSPYQAVYGQKPRLPRANMATQEEGERLRAIRLAGKILHEYRSKQKETYKEQEPRRAKSLPPGTFVSVRVLNPKKGETHWQPGYQVVSSHDGALRVMEVATGNVIRVNQRNVREIPESKPYDEIDPISPSKNPQIFDCTSTEAKPVPIVEESYLPTRLPVNPENSVDASNLQSPSVASASLTVSSGPLFVFPYDDWSSWCDVVYHFTH